MQVTSAQTAQQLYAAQNPSAVQAASAYAERVATASVSPMEAVEEKYQDIYTPIPETYTPQSEAVQREKIHEAYPDYIPPQEFMAEVSRIYTEEFGMEPLRPDPEAIGRIIREQELPDARLALSIFTNYRVYDSVDIRV